MRTASALSSKRTIPETPCGSVELSVVETEPTLMTPSSETSVTWLTDVPIATPFFTVAVEVEVTVLSCADRLATRGKNADRAIELHLDLARELMAAALDWRASAHSGK